MSQMTSHHSRAKTNISRYYKKLGLKSEAKNTIDF